MKKNYLFAIVAVSVAVITIGIFFWFSYGYIGSDESNYMYEASNMLRGAMPLIDFPSRAIFQLTLLMGFAVFTGASVLTMKLYGAVLFAATGLLTYVLIRKHVGRGYALMGALAALIAPAFFLTKLVINTTNLNIVCVLASFYFMHKKATWSYVVSGGLLALAVFTRETSAFFIIALFMYLTYNYNWKQLVYTALGGLIVALPVLGYFTAHIGVYAVLTTILGVGHVIIVEKMAAYAPSGHAFVFLLLSIMPMIIAFMFLKKRHSGKSWLWKNRDLYYPELLWIASMCLFYIYYLGKRGFLMSYGSEIIPALVIATFALCRIEDRTAFRSKYAYWAIIATFFAIPALGYLTVSSPVGPVERAPYTSFTFLVGSGIPRDSYDKALASIRSRAHAGDAILSGTMAVPVDTGLTQFENISRMLIYENGSQQYEIYNVPQRPVLVAEFMRNPTKFIVAEHHYGVSFKADLQGIVSEKYESIYADRYVEVYMLKGPTDWVDPQTNHRIIQISSIPGSMSLYFHQNAYTPQGDKVIIYIPGGLASIDLKTRAEELIVPGFSYSSASSTGVEMGRKTRTLYYQLDHATSTELYATNVDTKATHRIAILPARSEMGGVNADETLIVGKTPVSGHPGQLEFFTANIQTGEVKAFLPGPDFINHIQPSPTDPSLILFAHEGRWEDVDRIWTVRTDGSRLRLLHKRSMPLEVAGHEFMSHDGQSIWFDLQTPKAEVFWLAGIDLLTGRETRYSISRETWSVHYNLSWNGRYFAGDGGGPLSVANRLAQRSISDRGVKKNGQWIYLYRPTTGTTTLETEKLVDLSKQDYSLEPNVTFTPDGKWIIFRSNMSGESQVYMVEVAKASLVQPLSPVRP